MNVANLEVLKGLVAHKDTKNPQLIQVSAATEDIDSGIVDLKWNNVQSDGTIDDPFASAKVYYGDTAEWVASWAPVAHLVQGRMESLERMAEEGKANKFSHDMAYRLFANNLVDYANKYRGMQSVILHEFEAVADIVLSTETGGTWTVPPYFIDSVAHLAGFIMNVSDAVDTKANFCVTPGWRSMRFAHPLVAGGAYRSYTKMIPSPEDPTTYFGDVYIFQDTTIIGMVGGIQFHRYPRILLNRFFSAPDEKRSKPAAAAAPVAVAPAAVAPKAAPPKAAPPNAAPPKAAPPKVAAPSVPVAVTIPTPAPASKTAPAQVEAAVVVPSEKSAPTVTTIPVAVDSDSTAAKAIALIAKEAALELTEVQDEASFLSLGIDSLMSLVIAEKFREELGVTASGGGLFLEYPTIGDLRAWLEEYYS